MRRAALWLVAVGVAAALGAAGWWIFRPTGLNPDDVPVVTVASVPFTRTVSAEGVLKATKTTVVTAPSKTRDPLMIAWMLDDGDPVKKGDVVVRFDSGEVNQRLADHQTDRQAADTRIEKERNLATTTLHERDRAARLTSEEIARNQQLGKKDPRFFPKAEVIESEIDDSLYEQRLAHSKVARKIEQRLSQSRLELVAIDQRKAEMFNQQAKETLEELELRAPHDGTFVLQRWGFRGMLRAGDRAFPGMRIAEISTSERMDAEVFVLEADAGGLAGGRPATVVLEAQPDVVWKGKVKRVDPFPKPRQPEVPAQYFATLLSMQGNTNGLRPGQRLHATIVLDEQPNAMVVPRQAIFRRDNDNIVYRRTGARFEPVKVKLGPGTVGRLVIASGVAPGDRLALRDPTVTADQAVAAPNKAPERAPSSGGERERGGGGGGRRR